ncbi:MAG: hypothetical protein MJZ60_09165, partial [Bacteroidaceae bacterium]|nr:hypothetical protein [Bacteroidaceae bacterium]
PSLRRKPLHHTDAEAFLVWYLIEDVCLPDFSVSACYVLTFKVGDTLVSLGTLESLKNFNCHVLL